ncbi:hypothetical protein FRB94_012570 [Tulasnella sp. JGI-2019a]|nr:hypothetical protein FRB94_012570 [Tulasnella sp. JGI-2019a]
MTLTFLDLKSGARRATSPSSVVHTGVKSMSISIRCSTRCHYYTPRHTCGMREEDHPAISNPIMELDGPLCSLGLKVRRNRPKSQRRHILTLVAGENDRKDKGSGAGGGMVEQLLELYSCGQVS